MKHSSSCYVRVLIFVINAKLNKLVILNFEIVLNICYFLLTYSSIAIDKEIKEMLLNWLLCFFVVEIKVFRYCGR